MVHCHLEGGGVTLGKQEEEGKEPRAPDNCIPAPASS